ncbi:hypothetical protein QJQ45_004955 [Haematococcus lacustris]|nr:hypothetical protein QJQ45_004955 [Haematococcus lacustris]
MRRALVPAPASRRLAFKTRLCCVKAAREADVDIRKLLTSRVHTPSRHVGPVKVVHVRGKGVGLVATEEVAAGQLLLCVPPLAAVYGRETQTPDTETLAAVLLSRPLEPGQVSRQARSAPLSLTRASI